MNNNNPFVFGSMNYLIFEAKKVDDILYLIEPDITSGDYCLKIVCRPGYNINSIMEFVNDHLPIHITSEVIVESEEIIRGLKLNYPNLWRFGDS